MDREACLFVGTDPRPGIGIFRPGFRCEVSPRAYHLVPSSPLT